MLHFMSNLLSEKTRQEMGARIKSLRKERGLTQKELAAQLGIQHTHVYKYESGTYTPPVDKLTVLADLFGISLDFLILGKHDEHAPVQNLKLLERIQIMDSFSHQDQEAVIRLIDAMILKHEVEGRLAKT